jgi:two-component system KDP operon response regulator KdpE
VTEASDGVALRILSLDDDVGNQSLIAAIVARTDDPVIGNATLLQATTIAQARAILDRDPIDLVLLDVHLPDGLGLDLATELRERQSPRPAVLALTASVLPAEQHAALDAGCDAFLAKPFAASGLIATMRRLLRERGLRTSRADESER